MEASQPKWWTREQWVSVGVFAGFTLLNVLLVCVGGAIDFATLGPPPPPGQMKFSHVWLLIVAFPVTAAIELKLDLPAWAYATAWLLNPVLYGGMGWLAWRMWKLMRRKRESE